MAHDEHGSAVWIVRIQGVPEDHRLGDFHRLEGHSGKTDDPHPENGAGPSQRDGHRDAADVAESNRGRERRRQRLEVVDRSGVIGVVVLSPNDLDAVGQRNPRRETGPDQQKGTDPEDDQKDVVMPENVVDVRQDSIESVHALSVFPSSRAIGTGL